VNLDPLIVGDLVANTELDSNVEKLHDYLGVYQKLRLPDSDGIVALH
jgi:hypothetical protein